MTPVNDNGEKVKVMLSVGHYEEKPGAENKAYGLKEWEVCKRVVDRCFHIITNDEHHSKVTLPFKIESMTLPQKKEQILKVMPDLIVEVHMNSSWIKSHKGILTIYEEDSYESMLAAKWVNMFLVKNLYSKDLGIFADNIVKKWRKWNSFFIFDRIEYRSDMIHGVNVPTILAEMDFISNPKVAVLITKDSDWVQRAAGSLALGVVRYCQQKLWENTALKTGIIREDANG